MPKLKLERFRKLYKSLKTPWKPLNWLILGYLIGIEDRYINIKAADTVDTAIRKFNKENPDSVKKPEINSYLVAENIAQQLVKRISYRRAMKRAMQSCIRLGAKGIKV